MIVLLGHGVAPFADAVDVDDQGSAEFSPLRRRYQQANRPILTHKAQQPQASSSFTTTKTKTKATATQETKRVWVRYKKQAGEDHKTSVQSLLQRASGLGSTSTGQRTEPQHQQQNRPQPRIVHDFPQKQSVVLTATDAQIQALGRDPLVQSIQEDPKRFPHVHAVRRQQLQRRGLLTWDGQASSYGVDLVQARAFWRAANRTGEQVTICIIDSGFDVMHEDFRPNQNNYNFTTGETFVESFAGGDPFIGSGPANMTSTTSTEYLWSNDLDGHGTHVAGIMALQNNDIGLVGVAPGLAHLHIVQVLDETGLVYASSLVDAAYACRDAGANIINMSLGGPQSIAEERDVFTELYTENNILSVASSGNSGVNEYYYPAAYNNVLAVGAIDQLENFASFSTYNDKVDLVAPGVDVWSALPMNFDCLICQELVSSGYASLDGTSQAAPHVAAAAALLWSYNISAPVDHIHNALLASAADLGPPGRDDYHGYGLVKVRDALDILKLTLSGEVELQDWSVTDPLKEGSASVTCSETELLVTVNLLTDRYGNETSWSVVRNVDEFTVMSEAGFASRQTSARSYCLPNNCYTFEIRDSYGDGISGGEYGNGHFDVMVNGKEIVAGGNFTFFERASFGGDCVELTADAKPALPSLVEVKVILFTDAYPLETLVSLENVQTGELFWNEKIFDEEETEYTLRQEIDPSGCYNFAISDVGGDGICCLYGFGYFELFVDDVSVFTSDGDFGSGTSYFVGDSCSDQI